MLLLRTIICLFLCLHLTSAQDNTEENNPTISACPPCDCTKPVSCEESDISNPCSCCGRCHKSVGDVCGANEGECTQDLLCLPDDPYSANYIGKCYEITPCLTFGCSEKEGECECYYNNVCPLQRLPYYTREECEDAIKVKKCKEVRCSMKEDCGEGMYFEEGPSFFDDCCPVNGHCVCNVSLCTGPPKSCPVGTKLIMTEAADQKSGKCCNKYECQPITCSYKGVKYAFEEEWMDDTCTTCTCTEGGAECASVNCSEPVDCSITYIPEGKCCPVCFNEPNEALPPETTSLYCITDNGERHEDGNSWDSTPCVMCTCSNGEINCNKKACDVVPCNLDEGQEYVVPMGKCCPICKDATSPTASATVVFTPSSIVTVATETPPPRNGGSTPSDGDDMPIDSESTEPGNSDDTPSNEGTPSNEDTPSDMPSNNSDTPSNNEEVNPTRPSNQIRNLVLLLNIPYKEVKSRWEQFSSELADKLREKKITLEDISIMPDVSSTVNATLFTLALKENTTATGPVHEETSESDIAVIVNQMAVDYKMMPEGTAPVVTPYNNAQPSFYESYQTHLTATIVVLTLLAAVSLVSFIGVVIILVIINRRLKTAKTIRGIPTKPSKGP